LLQILKQRSLAQSFPDFRHTVPFHPFIHSDVIFKRHKSKVKGLTSR
jgi:hypothetical protein